MRMEQSAAPSARLVVEVDLQRLRKLTRFRSLEMDQRRDRDSAADRGSAT
jgi:hypothetical protein